MLETTEPARRNIQRYSAILQRTFAMRISPEVLNGQNGHAADRGRGACSQSLP